MTVQHEYQKGQVLLIIVLVMVVALTVGLSVVTRSITNLQITTEEENSQRALSAAEAGIERALSSGQGTVTVGEGTEIDLGNNSRIKDVNVDTIGGNAFLVNNGNPVFKDDGADVWLSNYSQDPSIPSYTQDKYTGTVSVHWGAPGPACDQESTTAAVEILVLSGDRADPVLTHYPVDPCADRRADNNFCGFGDAAGACPLVSDQDVTVEDEEFGYTARIPVTNGLLMRVMPLYAQSALAVEAPDGTGLPRQGDVIESVGQSGTAERKVTVYRGFPRIPMEFFPYVIFSP